MPQPAAPASNPPLACDWHEVPGLPAWVPAARRPARGTAGRGARPAGEAGAGPAAHAGSDAGEVDRRRALLGLLATDLARGNQQVALRHYLMLVALGSPVPAAFSQRCEALLAACPPDRLRRIRADVARWRADSRPAAGQPREGFDLRLLER